MQILPNNCFQDRMQTLIKRFGSQEKLGDACVPRISGVMIGKYALGKAEPARDKLVAIAKAADCDIAWLVAGDSTNELNRLGLSVTSCKPVYKPVPFEQLDDLSKRILQLPELLDLDEEEFCQRLGMDAVEMAQIKAGRPVSGMVTRAVCYEFGIRMRWLKLGELPHRPPSGAPDNFARDMIGLMEEHANELRRQGKL